jgi:TRAP transporter 4TM/12TM fusion protein
MRQESSSPTLSEPEITRYKNLPKILKAYFLAASVFGILLSIFFCFGFTFRGEAMAPATYYYLLMAAFSSTTFLILPAREKDRLIIPWYDVSAASLALGISSYFCMNSWYIYNVGWIPPTTLQFVLALVLCLLILEGGRRMAGLTYTIVCMIFGVYPVFAGHMPGIFFGTSFTFPETVAFQVFGGEGIIGLPSKIVGELLIGFLIFAGVMIASGVGAFFLDFALSLFGRYRGGPAKVCAISSGLFGSLSGNVLANVVATGSITIPAMKRMGFPPHYAAAIEACGSTGSTITPPVMGAVAFVMCAFLNVDYGTVCIAAALPAILYYFGIWIQIDSYAAKVGLKGLPREELPSFKKTIKEGWAFAFVFLFLIWGLVYMKWEWLTPFYATGLMIILSYLRRGTMMTPRKYLNAIISIGTLITQSIAVVLPIGFIVGALAFSGMSAAFTAGIISLGGGNLYMLILLGAVSAFILGCGGMFIVAYIFLAVSLAPAIIQIGHLNVLAVHLFILYNTMLATITPPVAVASFLAATIAGSPPIKTAIQSMRFGFVQFIIPVFFLLNPALILEGPVLNSIFYFVLCLLGVLLIGAGFEGYLYYLGKIGWEVRLPIILSGFLIALPEWKTTVIGALLGLLTIAIDRIRKRSVGISKN